MERISSGKASVLIALLTFLALLLGACQPATPAATDGKPTIVVTYSILGSVVKDLVAEDAQVVVLIPNGQDPHEWEPSAKDIETLTKADLVVQNGLSLEGGTERALGQARDAGVPFFTASDHITVRRVGPGEGIPSGDPDQAVGAADPHLWMDPVTMKSVADALAEQLSADLPLDPASRAADLDAQLDSLNQEIADQINTLPEANRRLVTGHESLGYYAERYGLKLVGAIIPSITTQAGASAYDLASLKRLIEENQVKAIFTEVGTPASVAEALGQETGVAVIPLNTHTLPEDGSYVTFMRQLTQTIVDGLS